MVLVRAKLEDVHELQDICVRSYEENFRDHWIENGLELFLEREFGKERLLMDLTDENIAYYFITIEGLIRGFIKVAFELPTEEYPEKSSELIKIYLLPEYKGAGYGSMAVAELIQMLQEMGKENLFLYVIDTNQAAITFYGKMGFEYHSHYRMDVPLFKDELRNMHCMLRKLSLKTTGSDKTGNGN